MNFEYISIIVTGGECYSLVKNDLKELNSYYQNGWEFVNSVAQVVSYGASGCRYAPIIFTLRKEINLLSE